MATCDSAEGEHLLLIKCDSNGRPSPPRENIERFTRPRFFIITKCCRSSFRHSPTVSISQRKPKNESKKQKKQKSHRPSFFFLHKTYFNHSAAEIRPPTGAERVFDDANDAIGMRAVCGQTSPSTHVNIEPTGAKKKISVKRKRAGKISRREKRKSRRLW